MPRRRGLRPRLLAAVVRLHVRSAPPLNGKTLSRRIVPFTPFHFGPGLLLKSSSPRRFSIAAFVTSQVVIDIETLYWLIRGTWPVHRVLHTFVGGAAVGVAVAGAFRFFARSAFGRRLVERVALAGELEVVPVYVGSLVGGLSHSILDGIMHSDIRPFRPFSQENPLLGFVDVMDLHLACVATGLLGLVILMIRRASRGAG
jgi:hypothetical protein